MKVLVSCYACSPYQGSEPGMGWNFVRCLSRKHELHIITESKFKEDIDRYFVDHPEEKSSFKFYFIRKKRHKKLRKIWPPSYYWFYNEWQKRAYIKAIELEKQEDFDIIHQLNLVGYREPGYLWKIGKPFVWGPIGGFGITPWCVLPIMGIKGMFFYACRNIINLYQMRFKRRVRKAIRRANSLISATEEQYDAIKKHYARESIIIPEVGLEKSSMMEIAKRENGHKLKICWSAIHTPRKALIILLEALRDIKRTDIELHVIGEGSETRKWKVLSEKYGITDVVWYGWVRRADALKIMQSCHLFCITSLSDLTSTVLLEALSFGMPVITLDHCGFRNIVSNSCGRKIPIHNRLQIVRDYGNAIEEIADNEPLRIQLAKAAKVRAFDFNWEGKEERISKIYEDISL